MSDERVRSRFPEELVRDGEGGLNWFYALEIFPYHNRTGEKMTQIEKLIARLKQTIAANPGKEITIRILSGPDGQPISWFVEVGRSYEGFKQEDDVQKSEQNTDAN